MKIYIKILNGKRQNTTLTLNAMGDPMNNSGDTIFVLEDEALELSIHSDENLGRPKILLYENEVDVTYIDETDDSWIYKWIPKKLGRDYYECFFHNYYGVAELSVESNYNQQVKLIDFEPIEVLAKKINADRVELMLNFLANKHSDALCAFFRVTRRKAGYIQGDTPAEILLEQLENTINKTLALVRKIIQSPITKLSSSESYVIPSDSTNIDDTSLAWICDNIDELYETDCTSSAILEHDYKLYSAAKIRENKLYEDTNVYENQIIHGFISTLCIATSILLYGFETPLKSSASSNTTPLGYLSFFSQIKKFQKNINERKILKCKNLLIQLHSLKKTMSDKLAIRKEIKGIPIFTMKAKNNSIYLSLFKKIVEWNRYGKPDWSVQDELLSIQSIPKLFEYYTLFYIKDLLDIKLRLTPETESNSCELKFSYPLKHDIKLSLYYEPKFWVVNHPNADLRGLVNSEGWTVSHGKLSQRSSTHRFSNRSPDFVITMEKDDTIIKSFVMDAKYTTSEKAFIHYLPELTLKYLHGIHSVNKRASPVAGLLIINPDITPHAKHFHSKNFDLFSEHPVSPYITCVGINPGEEFKDNCDFENILHRIVELLTKEVKEQNEINLKLTVNQ
ncbi:DUF2357 domain-containing protein [Serratia proteamaculans]|uniref:DUF2357 domain-containing protein n=1 Tax=Serratia proteamaculans TaxID=28151 RepID=UPI001020060F|nr:DUF2357 domain-containing protein [Serratia proteamaculans]RYM53854.1 hypothetical protein BSQ97_03905 [Serratia proteamaculans]